MIKYDFPKQAAFWRNWRSLAYDPPELQKNIRQMKDYGGDAIVLEGVSLGLEWALPSDPKAFDLAISLCIDAKLRTYLGIAVERMDGHELTILESAVRWGGEYWYGVVLQPSHRSDLTERAVRRYFNASRQFLAGIPVGYVGERNTWLDQYVNFHIDNLPEWP